MLLPKKYVKEINDFWVYIDDTQLNEYMLITKYTKKDMDKIVKDAGAVLSKYFDRCDDVIPAVAVQEVLESHFGKLTSYQFWKIMTAMGFDKGKRVYAKRFMSDVYKQIYSCPVGDFKISMRCFVVKGLGWKKELMPQKNDGKI